MSRLHDLARFVRLLRRYVAPHWPALLLLLVTSALATALTALLPVVMAPILELALGGVRATPNAGVSGLNLSNLGAAVLRWLGAGTGDDRFRAIVFLCLAYVAVGLVKGWLDFGNYLLALWLRVRAASALQADLFRHLLTMSMSFFTRHRSGELVSRLSADTRSATAGLETIVVTAFSAPLLIAFYAYLLARTSPRLVTAALAAAVLHYAVTRGIRGPVRRFATDQFSVLAEVAARFQEALVNVRTVKSFAAETFELKRLGVTLREVLRVNVKFGVYKHIEEPARAVVNYVVEAGLIVLAAWELLAGRLTASAFFLFLYVGRAAMVQIALLAGAYTAMQSILAATSRVDELFAERDGSETIDTFRDRIALRDVSFRYDEGEPVLWGVNLEVRKGQVVAVVGPSGGGKSTLIDLVLRLYDTTSGTVTIDGRDVRSLRQTSYRRLFGVVAQEPLLFNTTIRDNIAYGREGVAEAEIVRAARVANAHDFIAEFHDGYDTVVGDRGIRLSGGQRQRIAIARAVVGNPPILILDEATSSLDSESERLVRQAIEQVVQGATSIVVAHRLSTVLHADTIVVLNHGGVEAMGRHAELLETSETYRSLYRLQFSEAGAL
jgi:ABC-type multidrug transport system fused ATPase/permease subunit